MGWGGTSRRSCCLFTNLYIYLLSFTIVHSKYSLVLCLVPSAPYGRAPLGWFFPFLLGRSAWRRRFRPPPWRLLRQQKRKSRGCPLHPSLSSKTHPPWGISPHDTTFLRRLFSLLPSAASSCRFPSVSAARYLKGGRRARLSPCSPDEPLA